jgi:hypothetical protein
LQVVLHGKWEVQGKIGDVFYSGGDERSLVEAGKKRVK